MPFIYQCLNKTSIYNSLDSSITQYTPATMSPSEIRSSSASQNSLFMKPKDLPLVVHKSPPLVSNLRGMTTI